MNNDQVESRLDQAIEIEKRIGPALAHEYDREKMFGIERARNKIHNEKFKESNRASSKRRSQNPRHKAAMRIQSRLGCLIKEESFYRYCKWPVSNGKAVPIDWLLGTTAFTFNSYLSQQFHSGMKWSNYGTLWHLGHRVPVRLFDCTDDAQARCCFHYKNLQPELGEENMRRMNEVLQTPDYDL